MLKNVTPVRMSFSHIEIEHLWKAWLAISTAFAIAMHTGFNGLEFLLNFLIATVTVGVGFIFHELAHKLVAQHYRCRAEFRADFQMLFIAIIIAFFGVIFAAPGAVLIQGHVNRKQNGIISLSGPLANIVLAVLFLPLVFLGGIATQIGFYGFSINTWLAIFNMLPFGSLDGRKVFAWNNKIYFGVLIGIFFLRIAVSGFFGF